MLDVDIVDCEVGYRLPRGNTLVLPRCGELASAPNNHESSPDLIQLVKVSTTACVISRQDRKGKDHLIMTRRIKRIYSFAFQATMFTPTYHDQRDREYKTSLKSHHPSSRRRQHYPHASSDTAHSVHIPRPNSSSRPHRSAILDNSR